MRLIDADALIKEMRKEVLRLYGETIDECAEHLDLDDDRAIYLHGIEQYLKIKFAYHWLKSKVDHAPTVEQIGEKNDSSRID